MNSNLNIILKKTILLLFIPYASFPTLHCWSSLFSYVRFESILGFQQKEHKFIF